MHFPITDATVEVLGKPVVNPKLQWVGSIAILPFFIGAVALVISQRMVDEERIRAEPSIAKIVRSGFAPNRVLTDLGKKVRIIGYAALGIGALLLFYVAINNR